MGVEDGPLRVFYIEGENLGKLTTHRVQRENVKQNEFHPVPKGAFSFQTRVTS